jgi:phosphate acetyltransferase
MKILEEKDMSIMDGIFEQAKAKPQRIAFPEATEEKILLSAVECKEKGICIPVLAGNPSEIKEAAKSFGINIEGIEIFDTTDEAKMAERFEKYVAEYSQLLSVKALTRKSKDPMYGALIAQAIGEIDVTFAGLTHSTGRVV